MPAIKVSVLRDARRSSAAGRLVCPLPANTGDPTRNGLRCGLRLLVCACQPEAWVFLISCPLRAADTPSLL